MTTLLLAVAVVFIAAAAIVLSYHLRLLGQALKWLHEHEQAHCSQIGELEHVVAQLAEYLDGMSATPLPVDVREFAARARDE